MEWGLKVLGGKKKKDASITNKHIFRPTIDYWPVTRTAKSKAFPNKSSRAG
jgi:hypothetical protein